MPGGRPKITTKDFPKDWKEKIIEMMSEGASLAEIQAYLDISNKTLDRLARDDKEFFLTIKRGIRLSRAWWEGCGRKNLFSKDFSYVGWYMNMKNRFGWRDRQDITSDDKALPQPIYAGKSTE